MHDSHDNSVTLMAEGLLNATEQTFCIFGLTYVFLLCKILEAFKSTLNMHSIYKNINNVNTNAVCAIRPF